jgi:hypothetical protein
VASAWAPNGPELARAGFASLRADGGGRQYGRGAKGAGWPKIKLLTLEYIVI